MNTRYKIYLQSIIAFLMIVGLVGMPTVASATGNPPWTGFTTPVFGLTQGPGNNLLVADAGAGIVMMNKGMGKLFIELPGVADMDIFRGSTFFAITGGGTPTPSMLFRGSKGNLTPFADLGAFEAAYNPDGSEIDSNPYDVEALQDGSALVADAGGNTLLIIDTNGNVDWVAKFPDELVSTANAKALVGCPAPPSPDLEFVCGLPDMMPSQAVATSIAVGPDGAYYVGELKGFPGPTGISKIWRVDPSARHADCGTSPMCSVVASNFTSIVDLNFGPDGALYVTEFDENSFLAAELAAFYGLPNAMAGGTVNACDSTTWSCWEVAPGLTLPIATAVDKAGQLYAAINVLIPGAATIIPLP